MKLTAVYDAQQSGFTTGWSPVSGGSIDVFFVNLTMPFEVSAGPGAIVASLLVVPIVLAARVVSVSLPITAMSLRGPYRRGIVPILTWCGLRGGISVAMMLSLPRFPARDYLLACTYAVVVFSILVQGLTVRRVLVHYGVGETSAS